MEKQRFLSLVDNAPFGMIMVDQDGNFQYFNSKFEEWFGYTLYDTPNGKTWFQKAYPDSAYRHSVVSTWKADIEKLKAGEQIKNTFEVTCKDGSIKIVDFIPVQMESGQFLVACNDITDRIKAEEALKESFEKLQKAISAIIDVIVMAVEMRDPYTSGHQKRVANLAIAIATDMGLPSDLRQGIHMAGMIHDLGKISVPAEILSKPTKLTDMEFNLIKIHPQSGYDILKDIDFDWPIAQIVLQHHERMDGSGYPNLLKNGQILLEAKILAVADVVEAMASHRPYRPALGIDAALKEIEKNKGILYDEKTVEVCVKLFQEKGFKFE
jgi:PAS domain S-box-containing protein